MGSDARCHGTCVARDGAGVLLIGPPGAGKSDLALRLIGRGFVLVADDQVEIADGVASAPGSLSGLLEVRGVGIVRLPHVARADLKLVVSLIDHSERLPAPLTHPTLGFPMIYLDPSGASAADRVALALDCALGNTAQVAGAFAA
jgi:HPr kinase/phosphorylase